MFPLPEQVAERSNQSSFINFVHDNCYIIAKSIKYFKKTFKEKPGAVVEVVALMLVSVIVVVLGGEAGQIKIMFKKDMTSFCSFHHCDDFDLPSGYCRW